MPHVARCSASQAPGDSTPGSSPDTVGKKAFPHRRVHPSPENHHLQQQGHMGGNAYPPNAVSTALHVSHLLLFQTFYLDAP